MIFREISCKTALSPSHLPGYDYALNPYRGCAHACVYCVPPQTAVLTDKGLIKISELDSEKIVSHKGRFCKANNYFKHEYKGRLITLNTFYYGKLSLTPNHKVLSIKREDIACSEHKAWVCFPNKSRVFVKNCKKVECRKCSQRKKIEPTYIQSGKLEKGDFVVIPIPQETRDIAHIWVSDVLSNHRSKHKKTINRKLPPDKIERIFELRKMGLSHRKIARELKISYTAVGAYLNGRSKNYEYDVDIIAEGDFVRFTGGKTKIPNKVRVDLDFMRLVGYYLAEGCVSISSNRPNSAYIAFTFNEKETAYISDVIMLLKKIFKITPNIIPDKKSKTIHIHSGTAILALFFSTLFGKKSEEMKIPAQFLYLSIEKQREMLKGLLRGDGSIRINGHPPTCLETASKNIKDSIQLILLRLGIICGANESSGGIKTKNKPFKLVPAAQFRRNFARLFGSHAQIQNKNRFKADIVENKFAIVPIRSLEYEDYEGDVYNLSIERDNSYIANFIAISNCYAPAVLRERREWGSFVDVKINMPLVLARELRKKKRGVVGISTVTDAYQPIERKYELTRRCLEQLLKKDFPVCIQTKSALVLRDLDLIERFSQKEVGFTITTVADEDRKKYEPYSSPTEERLAALAELAARGIKTWAFIGPIMPFITGKNLACLIEELSKAKVGYILVDKLRMKPGLWEKIKKFYSAQYPDLASKYSGINEEYFEGVKNNIIDLCRKRRIKCKGAW